MRKTFDEVICCADVDENVGQEDADLIPEDPLRALEKDYTILRSNSSSTGDGSDGRTSALECRRLKGITLRVRQVRAPV